ncbi:MAG: hypothetical protein Q7T63_16240 [Burkholderiaceae bacterium]|nr:hypothetical protein [Burkholderiaceae bacterium]MDO9090228.1 hypothetical protein [Burkholderiaceae bacterium]
MSLRRAEAHAAVLEIVLRPLHKPRDDWAAVFAADPAEDENLWVIFRSIALDQVRAIDRSGLIRKMTHINAKPALDILSEMFAA